MGNILSNNSQPLTVQQKEQMIVGTILYCNSVIKRLNENFVKSNSLTKLFESDAIHFNMLNLASKITGEGVSFLNENYDSFITENNFIAMNEHNNHYAYFNKVKSFLNGFELPLQKSLNESLFFKPTIKPLGGGSTQTDNASQQISNIDTFKKKLNQYISELEHNDDAELYSTNILKIKLLANKPLFIYGFNIAASLPFQQEICVKFNKNAADLISILFDKSDKVLMFVFKNDIITYSIKDDELKRMVLNFKFDASDYSIKIGENITRNTLIIYQNIYGLRYTDNLYRDDGRQNFINGIKKSLFK